MIILAAALLGSITVGGIVVGFVLGPTTSHWLLLALGAWLLGGIAGLRLVAPRDQRRLASIGYAIGACVPVIGLAGLYRRIVMKSYASIDDLIYEGIGDDAYSLKDAHTLVDAWAMVCCLAAWLAYVSFPFVLAFAGAQVFTDPNRAVRLPTFRTGLALAVTVIGSVWGSRELPHDVSFKLGMSGLRHYAAFWASAVGFTVWVALGLVVTLKLIANQRLARVLYGAGVLLHVSLALPALRSFAPHDVLIDIGDFAQRWGPLICTIACLGLPHLMMIVVGRFGTAARLQALRAFIVAGPSTRVRGGVWIRLGVIAVSFTALVAAAFAAPSEVFDSHFGGTMFCRHAADCAQGGCAYACYGIPDGCEIEMEIERLTNVHCECATSWCLTVPNDDKSSPEARPAEIMRTLRLD